MSIFPINFNKPNKISPMLIINGGILLLLLGGNLWIHYHRYEKIFTVLKKYGYPWQSKKATLEKINIINHENSMTIEFYTNLSQLPQKNQLESQIIEINPHYQLHTDFKDNRWIIIIKNVVQKEDIEKITHVLEQYLMENKKL
jgi:hypothetical protein